MKALWWLAIPMLMFIPLFSACGERQPVGRSSGVNCRADGRAYLQVLGRSRLERRIRASKNAAPSALAGSGSRRPDRLEWLT
jgi:hypothetical protein